MNDSYFGNHGRQSSGSRWKPWAATLVVTTVLAAPLGGNAATPHSKDLSRDTPAFCRAFARQLRHMPRDTPLLEWSSRLHYPGLSRPVWTPLKAEEYKDVIVKTLTFAAQMGLPKPDTSPNKDIEAKKEVEVDEGIRAGIYTVAHAGIPSAWGELNLYRIGYSGENFGTLGHPKRRSAGQAQNYAIVIHSVAGNTKIHDWPVYFNYSPVVDVFSVDGEYYWMSLPFGTVNDLNLDPRYEPSIGTVCGNIIVREIRL